MVNRHLVAEWAKSDAAVIVAATAVSGAAGYALTVVAHAALPSQAFVAFASFWAVLFFAVATLAGLQQEVARGTSPRTSLRSFERGGDGSSVIRDVTVWCAALVFVALAATSPWWVQQFWPAQGGWVAAALATGAACYVVVAAVSGVLYGVGAVRLVALMIVLDGCIRLALTVAALAWSDSAALYAWAIVLPFAVVPLGLVAAIRSRIAPGLAIDVGRRRLSWNIARTALAAAAIGVVVTALPFLISIAGAGESADLVASLQFVSQLTRAPLIVIVLSLQTLLVVRLRRNTRSAALVVRLVLATVAASAVLAMAAWLVGPAVGEALNVAVALDRWVYGGVVLSAGVTASLVITGAARLSDGKHAIYAAGWVAAALTQIACMAVPGSLVSRLMVALFAAPAAGILVHVLAGRSSRPDDVAQQRT